MKLPLNPSDIDIKNHHQIKQKQHHHEKSHENLHRITRTPYKSHENLQVFLVFDAFFNQKSTQRPAEPGTLPSALLYKTTSLAEQPILAVGESGDIWDIMGYIMIYRYSYMGYYGIYHDILYRYQKGFT
jgi:hypothetical protein